MLIFIFQNNILCIKIIVRQPLNFIKKVLQDNKKSDTMLIVAGPEGGFSLEEENYLIDNGFIPTTLGSNILRAETVPLYVLSVINYEYGGEL